MTKKNSLTTPGRDPVRERVLTFRVTFDQLDQLKRTARNKGTTVTRIIREAISTVGYGL
jgi:hypothetical protein